ncbi:ESPR-type extended signal peptide-containing protein [uncultured Megasphaera sp.]|uniref:ESPR-type extended signal peptide-containing protein n=2 Tax=uncultured Megasphaera sp. TaxID=165188 RepID=UPI00262BBE1B|nr:ESPR-type extended signal peptide-containing protein [uncultured Megasphaera sp.]
MNKIYKVVWSKVRNAYVVVSELAKRNSKTKSQHTARVSHSLLSLAVLTSLAVGGTLLNPMSVEAANSWGARTNFDNNTTSVGGNNISRADGAGAVAVGNATATGEDALALGKDASATGTETIAIGGATAAINYSIAMGDGAVAGGTYSVGGVTQSGANAVAIGKSALAYGINDVVIGANQTAIAPTGTAKEDTPEGTGLSSALGGRVMIGHDNIAYGRAGNSVIVGSNNRSNAIHGIAIGQNAYAGQPDGSTLAYENTMSIGTNTRSYSTDAIAIGNNAVAGNTDTSRTSYDGNGLAAAAIGSAAKATSYHTVAIGYGSQATDISAAAIGDGALASATSTTALGEKAKATSVGSLAAGAASVASHQYTTAVGNSAQATEARSLAVGYTAVASGGGAIAQGTNAKASSSYTMALGYDSVASAGSSMAIGYQAKAVGGRSISIGREATAGTVSTGPESIAIGYQANSPAGNAIAIGKGSSIDAAATTAVALGDTATANVASSVAIGSGSSTTRATDTTSQGWNNQDSTWSSWLSTKGNAGTTSGGVWNSTAGVVSIGTDGASGATTTRKLTGLAAGQYDTDAVNMKQWTNTMLATTGDFKDSSYSTTYGSDGTPRTVTKLLNQSLKITGGVDNTLYYQSDFAAQPNIGAIISDNTVTLRLNKTLRGLETIYLTNPTTGNGTTLSGNGVTIRPKSGSNVTLTTAGLNNGGNKITNVATGTAGTDGVNVDQLNKAIAGVSTGSGTTTTVTVEGGTAAGTGGTYTGNNLQLTSTTGTGTATYDLKLADNVTLGSTGTSGTDGSLTVNGKDGESVAINGSDGSIALTGADGSTATVAAGTAANDVNGTSVNRITVGGQTVATLNDGMVYTGDTGSAAVKLNKTVNIVGGETDSTKLSTDNNIGIVAAQDGDNGKLTVRLAKDITGLNTVEAGDAVLGNQSVVTAGNVAQDGSYVTGLDNTSWNVTNPDIVTGRAATEDQLKTVSDAVVAVTDGTSENATGGFGLTDDSGTAVKQDLGKTIQVAGDGNVTTTAGDGKITVGLSNTVALGDKGTTDGSMTVNGADGSSIAINGSNGSIVMNTADGSPVTIQAGSSVNDVTGSPVNRITVGGQTVATMNDGMKYGGDFGTVSNVKLNNQVDVKGEATTEADLTSGNIGVVSSQAGDNGLLVVKLNKDIDLGSTGSLTTGATVINNTGVTIAPAASDGKPVTLTNTGLDNGGNKITNVATGTDGTDAVNVDQLTKAIAGVSSGEGSKTNLTVEGGTVAGTGGNYTGSNLQITEKTETTGATTYDVKLADNLTLGSAADSAAGTEGTDSSITVNGKDGSAVAINGADGSIALNTDDGSPVTIKAGTAANDVNGNSIDRVTVGGATVATLDDGMVYTGDTGSAAVKLNKTVNIVGGETDASKLSTDNNIGIVAAQDGDNGKLTVRLAKDITGLNTVEAGDAVIGNQGVATAGGVAQDGSYVTGLDNTTWNVTNPDIVTGRAATEDQLKTVSDAVVAVTDGTSENATGGFGLTDDSGTAVKQDLGKTIQIAGDGNVTTTAGDGKITVGLSNTVALGEKASEDGSTEGADSSITVNGKDGSAVAINGADGSISLNTGSGSPITIQAGSSVNDVTGSPVNRITVGGQTVATMNDGMKYGGDFGTVSNVKLNNQVDVKGEATTEADLTTGNIGVVSSQAGDNGLLTVKLNKDINLGSTGSLTFGSGDNTVSLSNGGLNNGGQKITNVATGTDGTDAVNVDQLTKAIAGVSAGEGSKTNLTVEGGTAADTNGNYAGSNLQITEKTETTGATTYDVKLADKITLGSAADSAAGTEGTDSSITVNGKDGSAVAINGADGSIALNTADGSPVTIQAGTSANNLAGNPVDRITVGGQTVATMSDGLKFAGDDGQSDTTKIIPKTLNEKLDIVGGAEGELTDKNIGVNNVNGQLKVQLVKDVDLGSTGSLTLGNTVVNNNGITITPATGDPVSLTGSGLDNGNNVISNVATGVKGTDAVNVDQLTQAIAGVSAGEGSKTNLTVEGGTVAGTDGNYTGSNLQVTEKTETTGATTYDVKLADNLTLGSAGTDGVDGSVTVNGKDGSSVAVNGADGSITAKGADGSAVAINGDDGSIGLTGSNGTTTTIKGGTSANDVNGNAVDRITVGDQTVATLNDGMVYTGDTGSAAVKLNKTVNIVGGETDSSKLSADNNIGIVAAQDGDNGKLTVRLAKDITGLNTVTAGDATIGTQTETTASGVAQTGSYVTGLDNTEWNVANPDIVTGRAATEDQLKTVSDAVTAVSDGTSANATGGFGLADGSGTMVKQDLGKTITVKGGVTDGTATTENPTGTSNITTTVKDGALEVSLNKDLDLGSTGSVTTGNTVINNDGVKVGDTALTSGGLTITNGPSVTTGGIDGGSKQITNVASGSDGVGADGKPTYNNLTNGANIGDIKNITDAAKTELTNDGLNFTADSGDSVHRNLGETLNIAGDGNIMTTSDAANGKITVGLSNTLALGEKASEDGTNEGADSSITVNGKDGSAVAIDGADGSITLNTGSGSPITIQAGSSVNDVTGSPVNRITVGEQTVATMNDGMKYGGDFGTVSNVKLNNQVDVKGEATTEANLTTGNIGVVSSQAGDNGLLVVKLNKDIDLGENGSVTTGNTVVNNSGLTITNGPSVTTGGISAGGKKITDVATGTDGTDAVNVAQLEDRISKITIGESKTTEVTVEGGTAAPTNGTYAGDNLQVKAGTTANGSPTYDVKLADKITLGEAADSEAGTTGTDSSITLNGANGSSVAVNGADGSVTAKGTDGSAVAINGSNGSIVLNTGSGSPVTIQAGTSADNLAGTSVDRISVGGQTVATMSDGLKYAGDDGQTDTTKVIAKTLNEQLDIVGGADATKLTDNNIGVNNVNGQLKVQLVKDINLGDTGSVTVGTAVLGNQTVTTAGGVSQTGTYLTGLGNTAWDTSNPDAVTGRAATEDQLKAVNDKVNSISTGIGSFGVTDDSGTAVTQDLGEQIQIAGDGNITTTADADGKKLTVGLSNELSVGKAGTDGTDGKIGVNGKDGSSVVINGKDGSIGLTGPAGADGTQPTVTIAAGGSVNNVDGDSVDRITAGGQTIATMSDGQKYAGDNGQNDDTQVIAKKLNEQLDIIGGADATKLTENNIGVNNVNGQLKVQLAQNIDLGDNGSVKMGNTVVNNDGMTIGTGDTAVSLTDGGLNNGGNKITNVGAGTADMDAVNYGQLKAAATAVTVEGGTEAGTSGNYTGSNLKLTAATVGDKTTYDLKLADNLSIGTKGTDGKDGVDGSIGVNGKDGSSVVINGTDGISVKGADGKDGVTISGKDGVDGVDGAEGHIGLNGKDGMTDIYTTPGQAGVNGKDGDTMTRIIYTDPNGANHEVATLDDGMKYTGDSGSAAVKLNKTVNIVGGQTDASKLSTDANIGVVASQDSDNAKLTVQLAKDITGLNTVTAGDATIGTQTETTAGGIAQTGSYVTGLDNTSWDVANPDIVTGRAATEDQLKTVSDAVKAASDGTSENATGGFGLTDDSGTAVKQDLGKTIQIAGDGQNITTTADAKNGKITVALSNDISIGAKDGADGTDGVDGKIGVNGKDGSSVVINGADGSIGLTGPAGADGTPGTTVTITAGPSVNDVTGTPVDRITAGGQNLATLSDGMKYGGDFGTVSNVKLNNQVNVKGEATSEANLTTGNIGVVSSQDGDNGLLTVKLNKDINLGSTGSVTVGNTVVTNIGMTIGSGDTAVSLTNSGLNNGGKQITKVGSGSDGIDADGNPTYNTDTNGANIGDIKNITETAKSDLTNKGMDFTADSGETVHRDLGEALGIVGDGQNITTTTDPTNGKISIGLSNDLSIGTKGADGKDGVDGSIGVNGKDGSSVVINGTDGISVKGADGKDGVTITGKDGVDGVDGAEGHIGLNGKDGMTDIYTTPGQPGVNGKDGETMTRIIYTDPNGADHEVATLDDGMKYTGDSGSAAVKLNKTVNIVGGETDASKLSTDANIGVVASQDGDNAKLTVQLAKDITGLNTVTAGKATIGNQTETTAGGEAQTGSYVTGLENTEWNVANPDIVTGRAATEDQLKTVSDAITDGTSENATGGFGLTDDKGNAVKQDLGKTIQIAGDGQNITTTADTTNGKITVALSNDLSIGAKDGADGTDGVDGKIGVNGKDGSSVVINGADGSIGLTGPAGADGTPGTTVNIKVGPSVDDVNGNSVDRITVGGETIATMSDGQKYAGDNAKEDGTNVIAKKLNEQLDIVGGADATKLTENNIGVNNVNGQLKVQLAQNIDLGKDGSVTTGATVINNDGVTITPTTGNPVTLTGTGLNNGGNKITNVGAGTADSDAVNYGQLKAAATAVTVEGGTAAGTTDYAGSNLKLKATTVGDKTTYDLKLADNLSIGTKGEDGADGSIGVNGKDGSSVVINGTDGISVKGADGKDGVTISGKDGVDGVDGAEGHIGLNGKDGMTDIWTTPGQAGVNGQPGDTMTRIIYTDPEGNDHQVATLDDGMKYGGDFGNASAVKLNNQVNVKGNATNEADLTDGNIGVVSSQDGDNGLLTVKLNKDLNLGSTGSVTMGNTAINNGGVTIGSGTSAVTLTNGGLNNGGNQIVNVASGINGTTYDTSVAGQENYNNAASIGDLSKAVNNAVDDIKDANKGGGFALSADDNNSVKQNLGDTIAIAGDGNTVTSVKDGKLVVGLNKDVDLGTDGSIAAGNTTINKDGVSTDKIAIKDSGISIDKDGINAGNTQIKNVASGADGVGADGKPTYNTDTNGANIGDVKNIANAAADAAKAQSGKNITVGTDNKVNLNDNITLGDTSDASKQVNIDGNGATVTAGSGDNQVKLDGSKGQISAGGAVLGNQENTANDGNPATGTYLNGLSNTSWDGENIQSGRAATEDQLKTVSDKVNKGRVFQGDDGADNSVTVGLGDTLKLNGGANTARLSDGNIGVVRNSSGDGLDIKLAKDLKDLDSVTTGNTTINSSGVTIKTVDSDRTITIQDSNVNMGNNVVSGVADGTVAPGSTEAINGSQLALRDQAINSLGGTVNKLDNRINRVGAGAAALAALHPQDFDPDDKWDFAFGYGHYRGANAGAFGAFYKPNEDTTFSVGGTIGGGENMINAGVSFKLGQGNNVSNSRVGMAKEIKHLRDDVAKLEDIVNRQSQMINQLTGQNPGTIESKGSELFPDVPANHWAYEYVTKLHQLGIIEGYPDGNFDGNRMMTRYEFAAVVYRAIMAGAASNAALQGDDTLDRLANEFSAELKYIRIDTIAKDKDGKPTIQRVRIVPENKQN